MGGAGAALLERFSALSAGRAGAGPALLNALLATERQDDSELKYSINRLIKGTASNRQIAREGFFSALSILLKGRKDISIGNMLEILNKELHITGQSKGEIGELCTGHVLVCGAIMRSDLFICGTDEEREQLITALFTASNRRSYLKLATYSFITDFIMKHTEEEVSSNLWPYIKTHLECPIKEHSLDSLYCLIIICEKCPALAKKFLKKKHGIKSLICEETVAAITDNIMNVPEFSYVNHPIYEAFAKLLVKSDYVIPFWINGFETKLGFQKENRVLIVLTVLAEMLKNIGDKIDLIPDLLGDQLIPCILEWFRGFQSASQTGKPIRFKGRPQSVMNENKGRQIVSKAKEVFDILVDVLKKDTAVNDVKLNVLKKLLFSPGDIMFCDITNTRIIKLLIEDLNVESVHSLAHILKKIIGNETKKMQPDTYERYWTNSERLRAAEMLTYLINHRTTADNIKWRTKYMQFFIQVSLFKTTGDEESFVSSELSVAVKKCFFRCLTQRLPKLEILLKILHSLVKYINEKLLNPEAIKSNTKSFSPQVLESWKSMIEFSEMLDKSEDQASKACTVFQILALHSGLFLFSDVMTAESAKNSLQEVRSCFEHYVQDKHKTDVKKIEYKEGDIVDDEPEWTEVLIDIFLSFLSRDSYLLRNVVQCVFRLLCDYITPSAVGQILTVLDPDEDCNLMSYKERHDDDKSLTEEEENDDISDNENESNNSVEDSSESDGDIDDEDVDDDTTVNDQFRLAVQKALGNAAPDTDTESIDIDDLGEEEGKQIDSALSNAFKMLKQSKGDLTKRDKKNLKVLMEFRIRVLDLLNIYLEKSPSMEICLGMIPALFKCLEFAIKDTLQKQLEDKVRKCLKFLTALRTFASTDGVTMDTLTEYLKTITEKGTRTQFVFQALGDVISKCSAFIIRCSQKISPVVTPSKKKQKIHDLPIINIYKDSLEAFFTKRDCLLPVIFFHDILHLKWEGNWTLLETIIERVFDENVRQFRRNEGLEMIHMFYQNLKRSFKANPVVPVNLKKIEDLFSKNLIVFMNKVNETGSLANERFFSQLMKALVSIKSYHNFTKENSDNTNWTSITPVVQQSRKFVKLRNAQEYFKFCNLLGIEKVKNNSAELIKINKEKEMVDSGHDSNTDENSVTDVEMKDVKEARVVANGHSCPELVKAQKHRISKKNVSKKESKQLRLMASSQGFQDVSFTNLLQDSSIDFSEIVEEPELSDVKKSKRKLKDEKHHHLQNLKKTKTV